MKRSAVSPASRAQREKVSDEGQCRFYGQMHYGQMPATSWAPTPAHVIPRSLGGCDEAACVIPLCVDCHRAYDEHRIGILGLLTLDEQAHAAGHLGIARAYRRITNTRTVDAG